MTWDGKRVFRVSEISNGEENADAPPSENLGLGIAFCSRLC